MCTRAGTILIAAFLIAFLGACGGGDGTSSTQALAPPTSSSTSSAPTSSTTATSQPPHEINRKESPGKLPGSPAEFVRAVLTTSDPKLACQAYTPQALDHAYGGESGCEAAIRSGGSAHSVRIESTTDMHLSGARVVAVADGGPSDGEKLRVTLMLQDGTWRIASLRSNVPVGP